MDGGKEQRVAINVCFKAGLSATETLVFVKKAYVSEDLNRSNILYCIVFYCIVFIKHSSDPCKWI